MTGGEFLRKVKRYADQQGLTFRWIPARGLGSHGSFAWVTGGLSLRTGRRSWALDCFGQCAGTWASIPKTCEGGRFAKILLSRVV